MEIGFIGLGIMGSRMAANLQKAGHQLRVYNRDDSKCTALVNNGAIKATSPKAAAEGAAPGGEQPAGEQQQAAPDDDVVDAEFEEVDESKDEKK